MERSAVNRASRGGRFDVGGGEFGFEIGGDVLAVSLSFATVAFWRNNRFRADVASRCAPLSRPIGFRSVF